MMVRLKVDICPEEGLFTNARGLIVGLKYPMSVPVVIVDFPDFCGVTDFGT